MNYPRKWEDITNETYAGCSRLKIAGGRPRVSWSANSEHENLIFIPDLKHEWVLES